jgi:hypothetical protein
MTENAARSPERSTVAQAREGELMPRTSGVCPHCSVKLNIATRGRFLDARERPVDDWRRAEWKTCSECSRIAGVHVFVRFPGAFSGNGTRILKNEVVPQDRCRWHRDYANGNDGNAGEPNPAAETRVCCRGGVSAPSRKVNPPARAQGAARAAPTAVTALPVDPDPPLTPQQLDALAMAQVGWLKLSEEGRKFLRMHVDTERKSANRKVIVQLRGAKGALTCDACGVHLAAEYGEDYQTVLELHHLRPLARGVQKPKGIEDFALLCPTCHRVVHYRREEPLNIDALRARLRGDGALAGGRRA